MVYNEVPCFLRRGNSDVWARVSCNRELKMFTTDDLCSLRWNAQQHCTEIIDQTLLPHQLEWCQLESLDHYCLAISDMQVRGAPLIGITAAFGLAHALFEDGSGEGL